jgi:hypothetical protein
MTMTQSSRSTSGRKKSPAAELAERLVALLESRRTAVASGEPLPLDAALQQVDPSADLKTLMSAVASKAFKERAVVAKAKSAKFTAPQAAKVSVALVEDVAHLAASTAVLELALRVKRTATVHAFSISELSAALGTKLKPAFKECWNGRVEAGQLPPGIAFVRIRSPKLFLIADLQPASARAQAALEPTESPAVSTASFPSRFDEAFRRIDQRKGAHNFVSLVELRRSLADVPRGLFDAGLNRLRQAGRYTLSAAESVQGIRPEDREAGIEEAGSLLLYVSRKE